MLFHFVRATARTIKTDKMPSQREKKKITEIRAGKPCSKTVIRSRRPRRHCESTFFSLSPYSSLVFEHSSETYRNHMKLRNIQLRASEQVRRPHFRSFKLELFIVFFYFFLSICWRSAYQSEPVTRNGCECCANKNEWNVTSHQY